MKKPSNMIDFDNAAIVRDPGAGNLQPGMIAFSNSSRFVAASYNDPLTAYSVGYADPEDLWGVLERIMPGVPVSHRFNFKRADKASMFLAEPDDVRELGSRHFGRVEFLGDEVNARTYDKGLTTFIDKDELDEIPNVEQQRTGWLIQRLARLEIVRAINLLDAAASNTGKAWSGAADPDADMMDIIEAAQILDGIRKNTAIMGQQAWVKRWKCYRSQLLTGALASASMTPQQVAQSLMLRDVITSDKVKQTAKNTKARLIGSVIYFANMQPGAMKDDPSDFKRFTSATKGGRFSVFRQEIATGVDITVNHRSVLMSTSGLSTPKLTIT